MGFRNMQEKLEKEVFCLTTPKYLPTYQCVFYIQFADFAKYCCLSCTRAGFAPGGVLWRKKIYIAAIFPCFKQYPFLDKLRLFLHGGWNNKPALNKWNKKVWYILQVTDLLITHFSFYKSQNVLCLSLEKKSSNIGTAGRKLQA